MGIFDLQDRVSKIQLATLVVTSIAEFFCFIAMLTPAWQVAEDTDAGRSIQSGLWMYCSGTGIQCWYIFSDDLINYYERVDVCRFLLIGDCRKKLLRTPYFFGWHYAVLIIMLIVLLLGAVSLILLGVGLFRPNLRRITTVIIDAILAFLSLLLAIGLAVFMINAEMLESRYLIGVKNTFEKSFGYSFFLACVGLTLMLFALMLAIFLTTSVFFMANSSTGQKADGETSFDNMVNYTMTTPAQSGQPQQQYKIINEAPPPTIEMYNEGNLPRYCYSPSQSSIPTRNFLNY